MYVSSLSLTDYRSYEQADLDLEPGCNVFTGSNGEGKTNLVEAIAYASSLSSHRVATDAALVRSGAPRAIIRVRVQQRDRSNLVELEINPGRANRAQLNRAPVRRPREVLGVVRSVLFGPEDLALVKGDPDGRRRFLDELAVQMTPRMAGVLADYDRVLRQRNALLKSAGAARDLTTLEVWDHKLAEIGADVLAARVSLTRELQPWVAEAYGAISSDASPVVLDYRTSASEEAAPQSGREELQELLLAELQRLRPRELERGISLVGPHRDDLVLGLGELPAKGYASHGESWSLALALRLACYRLLSGPGTGAGPGWTEGSEPVLILDDVFAELDVQRRQRLAALVAAAEQVLVTAAVTQDVPGELVGTRYEVASGKVSRV